MYKVKIYNTDYNVPKRVYYHIAGILAENRALSSEIRAHEDAEKRLREYIDIYQKTLDEVTSEKMDLEEVIDKAIEYINDNLIISSILDGKKQYTINNYSFDYRELLDILKGVDND